MAKEKSLQEGTVVAGRYRIERPLGEGGMSTVYVVRHVHTGELLAMKILRAAATSDLRAVELFRREMRAPARIESEHVVRVTDADVAPEMGNAPFMVMELLRGRDLEQVLLKRRAMPASEVLLYLTQAARALDKAHRLGIVHRDLKPENLFLTRREDGTPWLKILDFGIAKIDPNASEGMGAIATTAAGEVFGTPLYMAPEQARGQNDRVGPWTDIWALGIIAHKMLTGRDPWQPRNLAHLVSLVAYEPIPAPSSRGIDLGLGFDGWFLRCCSRAPEDRFPTAGEAVTALSDALGVKPSDAATIAQDESARISGGGPLDRADVTTVPRDSELTPREARPSSVPLSRTGLDLPARRSGWLLGGLLATALGVGGLLLGLRVGVAEPHPLAPALSGIRAAAAVQASAARPAPSS
ncbi:MAG TPA: serine/threonine-protein kinase, partial [Candidatus Nanopelagicales bacterium]|nr:serine/threonine-protein kinase [Candidatus Nanopelagicales bacterium]